MKVRLQIPLRSGIGRLEKSQFDFLAQWSNSTNKNLEDYEI